jgi:formyl-CoA transferase
MPASPTPKSGARIDALLAELRPVIGQWQSEELLAAMQAAKLPAGKVNEIPEILADPQIAARGLLQELPRSDGTPVKFLGFPPKLSASPASYRRAPPRSGEDTAFVLRTMLGLDAREIEHLLASDVIAEKLA